MHSRSAAAAAWIVFGAFTVAVLAACSPRQQPQFNNTASVTIDGNTANINVVKCAQLAFYRTIEIGGEFAGAKVVIDQRQEPLTVESVHIKNLGGFTGMYSRGDGGSADLSTSGDKYTITGTANGFKTDNPGEPASAAYKIIATC